MFKLPYVICIIWESSVKCKVLFKRDCIYQCRISARNQLCFIPVLPQIQIRLTLCERIVVFLRNLSTLQLLALQISRSGSSKSIFHGLLMIPWFHYRFCLRENDQVQNSQLRIFYLQGSIYVPKIKVKQLLWVGKPELIAEWGILTPPYHLGKCFHLPKKKQKQLPST